MLTLRNSPRDRATNDETQQERATDVRGGLGPALGELLQVHPKGPVVRMTWTPENSQRFISSAHEIPGGGGERPIFLTQQTPR